MKKKIKSADEYGRQGGKKTLKNYGRKHYSKIAKLRWQKEQSAITEDDSSTESEDEEK